MAVTWTKILLDGDAASPSDTTPQGVGTTAAAGSGSDCARDDHVHDIDTGAIDAANLFAAGVVDTTALGADAVTAAKIADDAVGSEHIEALSADLDFAGNEGTDFCLHNSATDPATPVLGKVYFKTGDLHPYVCTVIA